VGDRGWGGGYMEGSAVRLYFYHLGGIFSKMVFKEFKEVPKLVLLKKYVYMYIFIVQYIKLLPLQVFKQFLS
jgi:hypothetical protein